VHAIADRVLGLWLGGLLGEGALLAGLASAVSVTVWLTVTVGFGSAVVAVPFPEPPTMPPRLSATTAVTIMVGQPNRFFGCC
jgi:hypothetical protein